MDQAFIRNFSIIAHIDHGKSTLADRMLLTSGAITPREFHAQMLDDMDLERERGITIKASAVTIRYDYKGPAPDSPFSTGRAPAGTVAPLPGQYMLNLIDTPGHVDFHYEVSRALKACDGALLVVDAAQGVEAQTVANAHLATKNELKLVPVINKIDLPAARPEDAAMQVETLLHTPAEDCIFTSAKTGDGIDSMMAAIIEQLPTPSGDPKGHTKALVFDSKYDDYRGVVVWIRVFDGSLKVGDKIRMMGTGETFEISEMGRHTPRRSW